MGNAQRASILESVDHGRSTVMMEVQGIGSIDSGMASSSSGGFWHVITLYTDIFLLPMALRECITLPFKAAGLALSGAPS